MKMKQSKKSAEAASKDWAERRAAERRAAAEAKAAAEACKT